MVVYGCAKAAVSSLMRSSAAQFDSQGIRANAISPGAMDAPSLRALLETLPGGVTVYNEAQSQGRPGKISEIADAAVLLASDFSGYITGQLISISGGATCREVRSKLVNRGNIA